MKRPTILLTSVGGLTGTYLVKHLNSSHLYRIIAIDMSELNYAKTVVDAFYLVPPVNHEDYLEKIKFIIDKENVDAIIPLTSYDVNVYSALDFRKELSNIRMLIMDYEDHMAFHNKRSCYSLLTNLGIRTPHVYDGFSESRLPLVLKPVESSGSRNTHIINSLKDYEYFSAKFKDVFLVEYLDGKEYTVDCLFDYAGKCLGANVRERIKTNGGGATISRNDYSIDIDDVIRKLESTRKLRGPINFQFKILEGGEICIFDFNTRFASGGLPLTVQSGFDIPRLLIDLLLEKPVEPWRPDLKNHGLTMVRYYEEVFLET